MLCSTTVAYHRTYMFFTTSWDDGYALDLRLADLLSQYGARGTFYVCPKQQFGQEMLDAKEILHLSRQHEIGAHTIRHPRLTRIPEADARREIAESKTWVEKITGSPCTMFCYPYGDWDERVASLVRDAGFRGARTVEPLETQGADPYALPTTLHLYPFPWRRRWKRLSHVFNPFGHDRAYWRKLRSLRLPLFAHLSWLSLAKALFESIVAEERLHPQVTLFFHLWGHSEEVERYHKWSDLRTFLKFVAEHDVEHVTNSELIAKISSHTP